MLVIFRSGVSQIAAEQLLLEFGYLFEEIGSSGRVDGRISFTVPMPAEKAIPLLSEKPEIEKIICGPEEQRGTLCRHLDD